jgi:hypothetical protein
MSAGTEREAPPGYGMAELLQDAHDANLVVIPSARPALKG